MPQIIRKMEDCRDYIERGFVLAYPTETTYGLGVNPFNRDAVTLLDEMKRRTKGKPYLMLVKNMDMLNMYAETSECLDILEMVWPGPVSVVLKAKSKLPEWMIDKDGTAGFRISSSKFVAKLFEYIDRPLITTSANPEGFTIAKDIQEVVAYFQKEEKLVIHPDVFEDVKGSIPSTIIDLTKKPPKVLRKGAFNVVF